LFLIACVGRVLAKRNRKLSSIGTCTTLSPSPVLSPLPMQINPSVYAFFHWHEVVGRAPLTTRGNQGMSLAVGDVCAANKYPEWTMRQHGRRHGRSMQMLIRAPGSLPFCSRRFVATASSPATCPHCQVIPAVLTRVCEPSTISALRLDGLDVLRSFSATLKISHILGPVHVVSVEKISPRRCHTTALASPGCNGPISYPRPCGLHPTTKRRMLIPQQRVFPSRQLIRLLSKVIVFMIEACQTQRG
jgi:hypothetical protein